MITKDTDKHVCLMTKYYQVHKRIHSFDNGLQRVDYGLRTVGWDLHAVPEPDPEQPIFESLKAAYKYAQKLLEEE